jgi:hypothetical protein
MLCGRMSEKGQATCQMVLPSGHLYRFRRASFFILWFAVLHGHGLEVVMNFEGRK